MEYLVGIAFDVMLLGYKVSAGLIPTLLSYIPKMQSKSNLLKKMVPMSSGCVKRRFTVALVASSVVDVVLTTFTNY